MVCLGFLQKRNPSQAVLCVEGSAFLKSVISWYQKLGGDIR